VIPQSHTPQHAPAAHPHRHSEAHASSPFDHAWYAPPPGIDIVADELAEGSLRNALPMFRDVDAYLRSPFGHRLPGRLSATTYALSFVPAKPGLLPSPLRHLPVGFCSVPTQLIARVEKLPPRVMSGRDAGSVAFILELTCKDARVLQVRWRAWLTRQIAAVLSPGMRLWGPFAPTTVLLPLLCHCAKPCCPPRSHFSRAAWLCGRSDG
jgi:hypothetical protein